jgi:YD repeat-containing protein
VDRRLRRTAFALVHGSDRKTIAVDYDAFGYPIKWTQPRGGETTYGWNDAGQLETITDALTHAETTTLRPGREP